MKDGRCFGGGCANGEPVTGDTLLDLCQTFAGPAGTEVELVLSRVGVHQRRRLELQSYENWGVRMPDSEAEANCDSKPADLGCR